MMISPTVFAEMELKGKSKEEILTAIRSIKREINRLKKVIEAGKNSPEYFIEPSPSTRLYWNREYLAEAIKAYKEAGGEYIPTKAEQKDQEFNEALNHLEQVKFTYGGYLIGEEERISSVNDDIVSVESNSYSLPPKIDEEDDHEPWTKEDFISEMKELHIGEWKHTYEDLCFEEGIQWELEIKFSNGKRTERYLGSNAYPYNFTDVLELFNVNEFLDEYDEDEEEDDEQNQN